MEAVSEEVKKWPDVREAFKDAFALLRQRKNGGSGNCQPALDPNPNQAGSNQIKPNQTG
jgi:hypothetical protein